MNKETHNTNKPWYKKWWGITIIVIIVLPVIRGITGDMNKAQNQAVINKQNAVAEKEQQKVADAQQEASKVASKEQAQKELDNIIAMGKKAGIVMSYDFSATGAIVLIDKRWYGQTVQFKKDFVSKVGSLKKAITGYSHFEVRDGYSNEKVAELTSFSQSIEIYK